MAEFEKINAQELENAAGGQAGAVNIKHVANIQSGYLAVRTAPEAKYENEIQSTKLYNGDTVQITGGHLYVNGELVEDPEFMASVPMDYPLRKLGADEHFVMGDNRYSSHDSRADDVGPLSRSAIMGKVKNVILPWGQHRSVK